MIKTGHGSLGTGGRQKEQKEQKEEKGYFFLHVFSYRGRIFGDVQHRIFHEDTINVKVAEYRIHFFR